MEDFPSGSHAEHQPDLVLERARTDPGRRSRGRIEIDIGNRIGRELEGAGMPGQIERAAQLRAIAQPREGLTGNIVVVRGGVGELCAPQTRCGECREAVIAAHSRAPDR